MDKYKQLLEQMIEIMFSEDNNDLENAVQAFDPKLTSIPFTNETLKNRFLKDLGSKVQELVEQTSHYNSDKFSNLISNNLDISYMPSRIINYNLESFFKESCVSDYKDFITILREVQISALKSERRLVKQVSELLKGENENTYAGLTTKKNLTWLDSDIHHVQFQIRRDELLKENQELWEKARNGEIDTVTFNKLRKINEVKLEQVEIDMEKAEKFTLYNATALEYRASKVIGKENVYAKEETLHAQDEYKRLQIESSLKEDELSYLQGGISVAEYNAAQISAQQKLDILEKTIENRAKKQEPQFSRETSELLNEADSVLNSNQSDIVIEHEEVKQGINDVQRLSDLSIEQLEELSKTGKVQPNTTHSNTNGKQL